MISWKVRDVLFHFYFPRSMYAQFINDIFIFYFFIFKGKSLLNDVKSSKTI